MGNNLPEHVDENDPDAPWNDNKPEPTPTLGECAVCGRPVPSYVPPRHDWKLRFCDKHGTDDLVPPDVEVATEAIEEYVSQRAQEAMEEDLKRNKEAYQAMGEVDIDRNIRRE